MEQDSNRWGLWSPILAAIFSSKGASRMGARTVVAGFRAGHPPVLSYLLNNSVCPQWTYAKVSKTIS